jgi:Uma2 family endonuclease
MSGMAVAQRMTVAEFLETDAPRFTTLIEGEVVVHAPRGRHQRVALDLSFALESWRRAEPGRGEVWMALGVALDDHNYYEPDLLWYSAGRERGRTEDTLHPLPDIAVEIRRRRPGATTSASRRRATSSTAWRSCGSSTRPPTRSSSFAARGRRRRPSTSAWSSSAATR